MRWGGKKKMDMNLNNKTENVCNSFFFFFFLFSQVMYLLVGLVASNGFWFILYNKLRIYLVGFYYFFFLKGVVNNFCILLIGLLVHFYYA